MRTTLTLDDDVAAQIEKLRRDRRANLKDVVNDALRVGLRQMSDRPKPRKSFKTRAFDMGAARIPALDNVAEVLALVEGDSFR